MRTLLSLCAITLMLGLASLAQAQSNRTDSLGVVRSPVLTINYDRFLSGSKLGAKLIGELEAERVLLEADNREIEEQLEREENELTQQRDTLSPEEFREAASAFDQRVQKIREERSQLSSQLPQKREELSRKFDEAAYPILARIIREAGAAVIVDVRSVVLSVGVVDITDLAIERLDAAQDAPERSQDKTKSEGGSNSVSSDTASGDDQN